MRIYAEPSDQLLAEINKAVKEKGIGKSQIVLEALDQYFHSSDQDGLEGLRNDLVRARSDLDKSWSEITRLRSEITALKADLEKSRSLSDKTQGDNDQLKKAADQTHINLELTKRDHEHALDTIRQDRDQICMLTALVHQLTEKITPALPPTEAEAKKKEWSWKFWR